MLRIGLLVCLELHLSMRFFVWELESEFLR